MQVILREQSRARERKRTLTQCIVSFILFNLYMHDCERAVRARARVCECDIEQQVHFNLCLFPVDPIWARWGKHMCLRASMRIREWKHGYNSGGNLNGSSEAAEWRQIAKRGVRIHTYSWRITRRGPTRGKLPTEWFRILVINLWFLQSS